jgi:hypothetical protein
MRLSRFALLWALSAVAGGCAGGEDGVSFDVSGAWSGTMTDVDAARTVSGNCTQSDNFARCTFTVSDPGRGTVSQAVLTGVVTRLTGAAADTLSYTVGVVAPPCSINVTGDAQVSGGTMESTYAGMNTCLTEPVRGGRLRLTRQ